MSETKITHAGFRFGTGFCGLLGLLFIALKLCGVIDWSWLWVLAPLWVPVALGISVVLIVFAAFVLVTVVTAGKR